MPEKTKTGKWIFPIRNADAMDKDGWFQRDTKTKGVAVRLAKVKKTGETVVQAYIFDTKKGWNLAKAKKWLKGQGINWIAALAEHEDTFKGTCLVISVMKADKPIELFGGHGPKGHGEEDDMPKKPKKGVRTPKKKKHMVQTPKKQGA